MAGQSWSDLLFAQSAGIGASAYLEKKSQETLTILGENAMSVTKNGKPEEKKITRATLSDYMTHSDGCKWWQIIETTPSKEAWEQCNCGLNEFSVDGFIKTAISVELFARIKKICSKCGFANSKLYASTDGFYHSRITGTEEGFEDYCDASEFWKWLDEYGLVKLTSDK